MKRLLLVVAFVFALGYLALGGPDGVAPRNGTYTFHRTDPMPESDVATGRFSNPDLTLNPGPGQSMWTKGPDGNYTHSDGTSPNHKICVYAVDGGFDYQDKSGEVVSSSGHLVP
jgi:hypothetical protein